MLRKCHLELFGVTSRLKIPDKHLACEIFGKKSSRKRPHAVEFLIINMTTSRILMRYALKKVFSTW